MRARVTPKTRALIHVDGMDAPIDAQAACSASINSGSACSDKCICDNCATQAVKCFSDSRCRNLVDCANRQGCATITDTAQQLACVMQKCAGEYADAGGSGLDGNLFIDDVTIDATAARTTPKKPATDSSKHFSKRGR